MHLPLLPRPPTVVVFVNHIARVAQTFERFLLNRLRDRLPFDEVPIRLLFRGRRGMKKNTDEAHPGGEGTRGGSPNEARRSERAGGAKKGKKGKKTERRRGGEAGRGEKGGGNV